MNEAIKNLKTLSAALEKAANLPENYNQTWSHYLEQMSWEMYKQANDLEYMESLYGITI